jgi:hypothetical protein
MDFSDPNYLLWAQQHAAANAKLEGRELPEGYVRSEKVEKFLELRAAKGWCAPSEVTYDFV